MWTVIHWLNAKIEEEIQCKHLLYCFNFNFNFILFCTYIKNYNINIKKLKNISDWIRKKVPAEFDLSLIDLDTILS